MSKELPETEVLDALPQEVQDYLDRSELAVRDPTDESEVVQVVDAHDRALMLAEIQGAALEVWVYDLPPAQAGGKRRQELSYKGVRGCTEILNGSGKWRLTTLPETLRRERFKEDIGRGGAEPLIEATIFARNELTGQTMPGTSTEPLYMKLTDKVANAKRRDGIDIPIDNRVFNVHAATVAVNKATRNALRTLIPEEAALAVIAAYASDPKRVARIRTEAEAKALERPPALTDDRAKDLIARAESLYDEIRLLGGAALVEFTPAKFAAWVRDTQHDHGRLEALVTFVESERDRLTEKYGPKEAKS